jgi:hypothetical protein
MDVFSFKSEKMKSNPQPKYVNLSRANNRFESTYLS